MYADNPMSNQINLHDLLHACTKVYTWYRIKLKTGRQSDAGWYHISSVEKSRASGIFGQTVLLYGNFRSIYQCIDAAGTGTRVVGDSPQDGFTELSLSLVSFPLAVELTRSHKELFNE